MATISIATRANFGINLIDPFSLWCLAEPARLLDAKKAIAGLV
jgi:hypothetical protein